MRNINHALAHIKRAEEITARNSYGFNGPIRKRDHNEPPGNDPEGPPNDNPAVIALYTAWKNNKTEQMNNIELVREACAVLPSMIGYASDELQNNVKLCAEIHKKDSNALDAYASLFRLNESTAMETRSKVKDIIGNKLYSMRVHYGIGPTDEDYEKMDRLRNLLRSEVMKNSDKSFFRDDRMTPKQYYELPFRIMIVKMKIPRIYRNVYRREIFTCIFYLFRKFCKADINESIDLFYESNPCDIVLQCVNVPDDDTKTALSRMFNILFSLEPAEESPTVDLCFTTPRLGLDEGL